MITFTDAACLHIKKMVEQQQGTGFRLSVKKTGCSGYSYVPAVVKTVNPADKQIETQNGIKVYVDTAWLSMLENLIVDFVQDQAGLKQTRLVITNPKEASRCGCGQSFHVE